jgi:hypothetical protein
LMMSHSDFGTVPTASMPAAAQPHCFSLVNDLRILAFLFSLCRWSD